jgi:hypothetical protein
MTCVRAAGGSKVCVFSRICGFEMESVDSLKTNKPNACSVTGWSFDVSVGDGHLAQNRSDISLRSRFAACTSVRAERSECNVELRVVRVGCFCRTNLSSIRAYARAGTRVIKLLPIRSSPQAEKPRARSAVAPLPIAHARGNGRWRARSATMRIDASRTPSRAGPDRDRRRCGAGDRCAVGSGRCGESADRELIELIEAGCGLLAR